MFPTASKNLSFHVHVNFAFGSYEFHSEMRFKTAIKLCGEDKTKIELNSTNHNYVISKE